MTEGPQGSSLQITAIFDRTFLLAIRPTDGDPEFNFTEIFGITKFLGYRAALITFDATVTDRQTDRHQTIA